MKHYDEIEEVEESSEEDEEEEEEEEDEEDMEPAAIPASSSSSQYQSQHAPPVRAAQTPSEDVDMMTPGDGMGDEGSEVDDDEPLFAGGDEEEESGDEPMEEVSMSGGTAVNGVKRKLVEEEDYD